MELSAAASSVPPRLRVGFVLATNFTLLAFAGFVDTLRLAADEGDRSRQRLCAWSVMSHRRKPIRASNGAIVVPTDGLLDPAQFDYVVVVGGTLHGQEDPDTDLEDYLRRAASVGTPLIGLCTGSLILARAGLMRGRKACVSWYHHDDYASEFPNLEVRSDQLFVIDQDRITCAGGVSVIHLASHLVNRHCGRGHAQKGLRIMIEDQAREGEAVQPAPDLLGLETGDPRLRRALLVMERRIGETMKTSAIAAAAGVSARQLERLFAAQWGRSPAQVLMHLRLQRAKTWLDAGADDSLGRIAAEAGFCDAAAFSRRFKAQFGCTPSLYRANRRQARRSSAKSADQPANRPINP